MRLLNRTMNWLREFRDKKLAIPRRGHHTGASRLLLFLGIVAVSVYVGAGDAGEESAQIPNVVSAQQTSQLEQQARNARGLRMAEAGRAAYTGEFFRVGGRKVRLLRSLEKIAVRYPPSEGFSVMNQLQSLTQPEGEFLVEHEVAERGIIILQTSKLQSLDDLAESIQRLEQTPGIGRAVPVYIHEESGLELVPTDEFVVKLAAGADLAVLQAINDAFGAVMVRPLWGTTDQFIMALPDCTPEELLSTCEIYWQDPTIEWAEPDFLGQAVKFEIHPNDPYYDDYLWHLPDIDAPHAWDITTGSDQICIAIIDDGMKLTHKDLAANLFTNSGERPGNGIDDDNNGYTDDYNGWNFYEQNNDPNPAYDWESHGTAVAGIAAAAGNNGIGVTGCAFNCKLMLLKIYKGNYYVYSGISEAILYAAGFAKNGTDRWRGADIINISSGYSCANCLDEAIAKATTDGRNGKGCVIFCSSGNDANGWSFASVKVSSGFHTIRWEYVKDSSESLYADTVWIDNVTFPDGSTETFEGGNLPSGWSTGGNANWLRVQDGVGGNHAMTGWDGPGSHSMRAGAIGHGRRTYLQVRKNFQEEGNINFNYWISTELIWDTDTQQWKYDALHVTVDGQALEPPLIFAGSPYIRTSIAYPASHPDTIAVGASTNFGYRSDYSCYGYGLDFVAPSGGGSRNTVTTGYNPGPEDIYVYFSGTSSSSPLAAGVGALILSKNPNLTASQVRAIMQGSCDRIGNVAYDENGWNKYYGYGRVNAYEAVRSTPEISQAKTFGGSNDDVSDSVQQTSDGGYIIAGWTSSYGAGKSDAYLIKTNNSGNLQWQKTFGGSNWDYGASVQQTSDGGYINAGRTESFGAGESDVCLIKTNNSGNSQWEKTFGGSNYDGGASVQQTSDGGYIIAGTTESFGAGSFDVYLIKTNNSGTLQWQKTFGGSNWDFGYSVQQTSDGGYIIGGKTSFGDLSTDVYLIKTNNSGNLQWQKTFGGSRLDDGNSVQQTSDGGYIIAGRTDSFGAGESDVYLIKTNSSGDLQWQKTFGGSNYDFGYSVQQTSDGGYIIAGQTHSFAAGDPDVYLIKTNNSGNLQWQKTFGGSRWDAGYSVQQTSDGGYIIAGKTESFGAGESDVCLIKTDSSGNLQW